MGYKLVTYDAGKGSRAGIVVCLAGVWAGMIALAWKRKPLRIALLVLTLLPFCVMLLPGRRVDTQALQNAYVAALQRFEGVPYVWGGENHVGIDCSGLVRTGLIEAETTEGLRTANPLLLRRALSLWWNDCSAQALGEAYQGRTEQRETVAQLNTADYSAIEPGDIAVTDSGLHTLAYAGSRTWIEADPHFGRVHACALPDSQIYFTMEAKILRWRDLEPH